jgi:hypothetical protein
MKTVIILVKFSLVALATLLLVLLTGGINQVPEKRDSKSVDCSIDTSYVKRMLLGMVNFDSDSNFVKVNPSFTNRSMYLEKNTYTAFIEMYKAAIADGVELKIVSGARTFDYQKSIWERKWSRYSQEYSDSEIAVDILKFSAMPGTSRHHWGTDIDINNFNNDYFEQGRGLKEYRWLKENAIRFGFCQVYTNKEETKRTGYEMEKWHWSYLPVALNNTRLYAKLIGYNDLVGFKGCNVAPKLKVIELYVFGVAECDYEPTLLK